MKTRQIIDSRFREAIKSLKDFSDDLIPWFTENEIKTNSDNYHVTTSCPEEPRIILKNKDMKTINHM